MSYRTVGALLGGILGLLIGGQKIVVSVVACVLTVPLGAALGYFFDFVAKVPSSLRTERDPDKHREAESVSGAVGFDECVVTDPLRIAQTALKGNEVTLFLDDPDTRRNPTDIRIV